MKFRLAIKGKYRVVGVDLFDHSHYIIDDYNTLDEACEIADKHNIQRKNTLSDVYYVYNDKGNYIRGYQEVNGPGISP